MLTRRHFHSLAASGMLAGAALPSRAGGNEWAVLQPVPLTGVNGGTGWHLHVGAQVAFAEANAAGGVFARPLRLMTLDEEPGHVADQLRDLMREATRSTTPVALLGLHGRRSVGELARSRLPDELGLPVIGVKSGSLSAPGFDAPWLFVTRASYLHEIDQVFRHATTIYARRVALLTTDDDDGKEIAALARSRAPAMNIELVNVQHHLADSAQVADAVAAIAHTPHDALLLATNTSAVAYAAKLYAAAGGRGRLIALSSAEATQLAAVVGAAAARGLLISQVVPHPRDPKIRLMREFSNAYRRHGPADIAATLAMAEGYIVARVLIDGLQRTGPSATGASLQHTLASTRDSFELAGLPLSLQRRGAQFRSLSAIGRDGQLLF